MEAEGWQDAIAGPLWSIVKDGGCEYVYSREDSFFAGVDDPTALRNRLFEWHARLTAKLKSFTPASPAEHRDRRLMNSRLADIVALIDRALEIESQRWQASRNPAE